MKYYPINLYLEGKSVIVVGGGNVAARKVDSLLRHGATVKVISPSLSPKLERMLKQNLITYKPKEFSPDDLNEALLVFAATSDHKVNSLIKKECLKQNILCNIVDDPKLCDFIVPAVLEQGELQITISTSGKAPALASWIKRKLSLQFGPEYKNTLKFISSLRTILKSKKIPKLKEKIYHLLESNLIQLLQTQNIKEIEKLLTKTLGNKFILIKDKKKNLIIKK